MTIGKEIYSASLKANGKLHEDTLVEAYNYANSLAHLDRFEEAKSLMRRTIPVAGRVLGEGNRLMLKMRWSYAEVLYTDDRATLDDLREAATTLEDTARIARRVLGGAHPLTANIEDALQEAQTALHSSEAPLSETDTP